MKEQFSKFIPSKPFQELQNISFILFSLEIGVGNPIVNDPQNHHKWVVIINHPWRDRPKIGAVFVDLIAASCWGAVMAATMMGKKPVLYTHKS